MAQSWRLCPSGGWMLWALEQLPAERTEKLLPMLQKLGEDSVGKAIRMLQGTSGSLVWEAWAAKWLSGEDRSKESAWAAGDAAWDSWGASGSEGERGYWAAEVGWAAMETQPLLLVLDIFHARYGIEPLVTNTMPDVVDARLADEIRAAIPEWPGKEEKP